MAAPLSNSATPCQATGLVLNTLTFNAAENGIDWLRRNNFDVNLLRGCACSLLVEFGVPSAERSDKFVGMTFALVEIEGPAHLVLSPALVLGCGFSPSKCELRMGRFHTRHITVWAGRLQFESPIPRARPGWPLPLVRLLSCLQADHMNWVLSVLVYTVEMKWMLLANAAGPPDEAVKRQRRVWSKVHALTRSLVQVRPGAPTASTSILPLVWGEPEELPCTDSCFVSESPSEWLNRCCADGGVWNLRASTLIPAQAWIPTVLHALKARILISLVAQHAVSPHRMLRGHVNPKLANVFWVSGSASPQDAPQAAFGRAWTWHHCLVWRISLRQLHSLPADCNVTDLWQTGSLHVLLHAPRVLERRSRIIFSPSTEDFGETLVLVLDYAGPAITTFMALRHKNAKLTGPVRAALKLSGPLGDIPPSENVWDQVFRPGWHSRLPHNLQMIDDEQLAVLGSIGDSTAPVHVIHAFAGCGKSVLLQCLVALYAAHHEQLPPDMQSSEVLMVALRTRTSRHELLQTLLHHKMLMPHQVIFGGSLPDRLPDSAALEDDNAHLEQILLAAPTVRSALKKYDSVNMVLDLLHKGLLGNGSGTSAAEAEALKAYAKDALHNLWNVHAEYDRVETETLARVAVVLVTTDVALKLCGRAATPRSPAARLMKKKQPASLIIDEMQRCPAETYLALASHHKTVVAIGDRGQSLHPPNVSWRPRGSEEKWYVNVQKFLSQSRLSFAADLLLDRENAAPGALEVPVIHRLTSAKRFGDPLAKYLARAHPRLCQQLRESTDLGKHTPVCHVWYKAICKSWYNLAYFIGKCDQKRFCDPYPWQVSAVVWHDGLSTCLAACVLLLLQREVMARKRSNACFEDGEMVVAVCSAIRRVVGPFELVMNALLSDPAVLERFDLNGIRPEHVHVRLPGDLSGPGATYAIVVRHPRLRWTSQSEWREADLQHHGAQTNDELNYIMETRPEKGLYLFIHDDGAPEPPDNFVPYRYTQCDEAPGDIQRKKRLEQRLELSIERRDINCEEPGAVCAVLAESTRSWQLAVSLAGARILSLRATARDAIARASGLIGDHDGDGQVGSVLDTLRSLSALDSETALRTPRAATRRDNMRKDGPPPLGDFGSMAWPRDPVTIFKEDWTEQKLRTIMVELAWRLVDHVSVKICGDTSCQIAVPLLHPLPGFPALNCALSTAPSVAPGAPLLTGFVLCVWAVYEAHRSSESSALAMMSVYHKGGVHESCGGEGMTWWSRACKTDQEAIVLLNVKEADLLMQTAGCYSRPCTPRRPPLYCYVGGGVAEQPTCITHVVVRTTSPALTAAVVTACRILGMTFPNASPSSWELGAERIDSRDSPHALDDLLMRLIRTWDTWEGAEPHVLQNDLLGPLTRSAPSWRAASKPDADVLGARVAAAVADEVGELANWSSD